jgi:hypothetical protein
MDVIPIQRPGPAVPSLYLSNWQDLVGVWQSHALSKIARWQASGIRELDYLRASADKGAVNQVIAWPGLLSGRERYAQLHQVSKCETSTGLRGSRQSPADYEEDP